jgi:hypothetical protein
MWAKYKRDIYCIVDSAVGAVREQTLCKLSHGEEGETKYRCHKRSPQRRRNGGTPVGHLGQIALRSEQCSAYSYCYGTTARWADILGPFLVNDSTNTFLQQQA